MCGERRAGWKVGGGVWAGIAMGEPDGGRQDLSYLGSRRGSLNQSRDFT